MNPDLKQSFSIFYYCLGAIALIGTAIKIVYNWFTDFEKANDFSYDMAMIHLPYIQSTLNKLAKKLDVETDPMPPIFYSRHNPSDKGSH